MHSMVLRSEHVVTDHAVPAWPAADSEVRFLYPFCVKPSNEICHLPGTVRINTLE